MQKTGNYGTTSWIAQEITKITELSSSGEGEHCKNWHIAFACRNSWQNSYRALVTQNKIRYENVLKYDSLEL